MANRKITPSQVLQTILDDSIDYETDDDSSSESDENTEQARDNDSIDNVEQLLEAADISDNNESDSEIFSEHNSNSEESCSEADNDEVEGDDDVAFWYGKDKTEWSKKPVVRGRTPAHNIITHLHRLKGPALAHPPTDELLIK